MALTLAGALLSQSLAVHAADPSQETNPNWQPPATRTRELAMANLASTAPASPTGVKCTSVNLKITGKPRFGVVPGLPEGSDKTLVNLLKLDGPALMFVGEDPVVFADLFPELLPPLVSPGDLPLSGQNTPPQQVARFMLTKNHVPQNQAPPCRSHCIGLNPPPGTLRRPG